MSQFQCYHFGALEHPITEIGPGLGWDEKAKATPDLPSFVVIGILVNFSNHDAA